MRIKYPMLLARQCENVGHLHLFWVIIFNLQYIFIDFLKFWNLKISQCYEPMYYSYTESHGENVYSHQGIATVNKYHTSKTRCLYRKGKQLIQAKGSRVGCSNLHPNLKEFEGPSAVGEEYLTISLTMQRFWSSEFILDN